MLPLRWAAARRSQSPLDADTWAVIGHSRTSRSGAGGQYCSRSKRMSLLPTPADRDVIVCYGGAKLADKHLAARVHCVDDEIIRRSEQS